MSERRYFSPKLTFLLWVFCAIYCLSLAPSAVAYDAGVNDLHGGTTVGTGTSSEKQGDQTDGQSSAGGAGSGSDGQSDGEGGASGNDDKGEEAEPVTLYSGQFTYSKTDIDIPGRMPLRVARFYRSGSPYQGMFGRGWNIAYNERIFLLANGNLLLRHGNSRRDEFTSNGDNTFLPPAGLFDAIRLNDDGSYTRRSKYGTVRKYDGNGCLSLVRDTKGNELVLSYEPGGKLPINAVSEYSHYANAILVARDYRLARIEVGHNGVLSGRFIQFSYNADGRVTTATDFDGRSWSYAYDGDDNGELVSVTTPAVDDFPAGLTTAYTYTDDHRLQTITDPAGQTFLTNHYDTVGRVATQHWGTATYRFEYPSETLRRVTDGNGYVTERTFDTNGNVLARSEYTAGLRVGTPASYMTTYAYNANHQQTNAVRPAGNVEEREYDPLGNRIELRRKASTGPNSPSDIVTTYTYDTNFNRIKTATDPRGYVRTYVYDYENPVYGTTNGNLMEIVYPATDAGTATVSFTHNDYGQVETVADALGTVTKYEYAPATGYLLKRISAFGTPIAATNSYTHDARGNMLTSSDPRGHATTYQYDSLDRLVQVTAPEPFTNTVTKYTYSANGKVSKIERGTGDPARPWQTISYTYDILDRLKTVTDDMGHTTTYEYDGNNNRTKVIDANGNATQYAYDERDLLWKVTDALTNTTEYAYSLNGNLAQLTDANGNPTLFAYDGFDRLVTNTYANGSTEIFGYNPAGSVTAKTTRAGQTIAYSYDPRNRLDRKTYPDASTIDYEHDLAGRLVRVTDTNGVITHAYDARGRLSVVTNTFDHVVAYDYDSVGNRSKLVYPDGSFIVYSNDALNRLTHILDGGTNVVAQFAYDALGRRTQLDLENGTRAVYDYDWANHLTNLLHSVVATASNIAGFAYTYDNVGNRLTMATKAVEHSGTHQYQYDSIYQLTDVDYPPGYPFPDTTYNYDPLGNRTTVVAGGTATVYVANELNQYASVGGIECAYDDTGNMTSFGRAGYAYDWDGRLTLSTSETMRVEFAYDGLGRLARRSAGSETATSTYDGWQLIWQTEPSELTRRRYVCGDRLDEQIVTRIQNTNGFAHTDGLGSTVLTSSDSADVLHGISYAAYGAIAEGADLRMRHLFTGRMWDVDSSIYHFRTRVYSPHLGRFLQPDPAVFSPNSYLYVGNSPVVWVDPLGLLRDNENAQRLREQLNEALQNLNWEDAKRLASDLARELGVNVNIEGAGSFHGVGAGWSVGISATPFGDVSFGVGLGLGVGAGFSVTLGGGVGDAGPVYVQGSVSGGTGVWGGSASGSLGLGGGSVSASGGWGVGGGASLTIGGGGSLGNLVDWFTW